jgi:hypothetical protein
MVQGVTWKLDSYSAIKSHRFSELVIGPHPEPTECNLNPLFL